MAKSTLDTEMKKIDQLIATEMGLGMEQSKEERLARMATDQGRIERFKAAVLRKESKAHRVAIDFGGGVIAQASTELMNWGFRALGKWSKDGFWANNVDLLQGAPHFVLGMGLYFAEMITRPEPNVLAVCRPSGSERSARTFTVRVFGSAWVLRHATLPDNSSRPLSGRNRMA